jgi:hypothetical protein
MWSPLRLDLEAQHLRAAGPDEALDVTRLPSTVMPAPDNATSTTVPVASGRPGFGDDVRVALCLGQQRAS